MRKEARLINQYRKAIHGAILKHEL